MSSYIFINFDRPVINFEKNKRLGNVGDVGNGFSDIKNYFNELEKKYGPIEIIKQAPYSVWGDTIGVNIKTGKKFKKPDVSQLFVISFSQLIPTDSIVDRFRRIKDVKFVHQPIETIDCESPNDPLFTSNSQWNLLKVGAPSVWNITKGSSSIRVGIIEKGGILTTHEDFVNANSTSQFGIGSDTDYDLDSPHGTKVASIVGAATNNNLGLASLGWGVKMISLKYTPSSNNSNLAARIFEAANQDPENTKRCDVINMSFITTYTYTVPPHCKYKLSNEYAAVTYAIQTAIAAGVVVVASTGNRSLNVGEDVFGTCDPELDVFPYQPYPASTEGVIGVGATDIDDIAGAYEVSEDGQGYNITDAMDVSAPGINIWVATYTSENATGYINGIVQSGTSFASPLVAALAGLILSVNPELTPAQVESIIKNTSIPLGSPAGNNEYYGAGRIDAYKALKYTLENYGGTLTQSFTIPSGETWNFAAGVTVKFAAGVSLTSNGVLNVNGTSGSHVTFTSVSGTSPGSWGSIVLEGSGAANSQFNYCDMNYGHAIECYDGANATINHCTLQNTTYGVICESSSPRISNNIIHNVGTHGIQSAWDANPRIENNTITNDDVSSGYGVYVYSASGYINSNTISGFLVGVYPRTYSYLGGWSGEDYYSTPSQNNIITGNTYGIDTWDNAHAFLGLYDYETESVHGGNNKIENNTGYDLVACDYTWLHGEGDWYGDDFAPTYVQGNNSAFLLWQPPLYTNPFSSLRVAINQKQPTLQTKTLSETTPNSTSSQAENVVTEEDKLFQEAVSAHMKKSYVNAQDKYQQLFSSSKYLRSALVLSSRLFTESKDDNLLANFEESRSNPSKNALYNANLPLTTTLLAKMQAYNGNYDRAFALFDDVIKNYPNTTEERNARIQKIYYTIKWKKDNSSAQQMLNELLTIYNIGDDIDLIKNLVDHSLLPSIEKTKQLSKESKIVKVPIEYSLSQNYPNPFNPTTTISFSIPQAGNVLLKVFDALGREVATLVNELKSEGIYTVQFNASSLSSGIYFYRLQAGSYVETKKLVLMK